MEVLTLEEKTVKVIKMVVFGVALSLGGCQAPDTAGQAPTPEKGPDVAFEQKPGEILIKIGGKSFATYAYSDPQTTRPYFAHIKTPSGIQATRNFPPIPGVDATDHDTFHPGLFLAFGDISGHDYWRLKAKVEHGGLAGKPRGGPGQGTFTVRNNYLTTDGSGVVCTEVCRYTVLVRPSGYLLMIDSTFSSDQGEFSFGEQDEMGLGVRVNTGITVQLGNGEITNAEGLKNENAVRERESDWCDLSGIIDATRVGVLMMPDPANLRRSWWHARDFGFTAGNFFGHDGGTNPTVVKPGEEFHVGYGVLFYSVPASNEIDRVAAYLDYVRLAGSGK